jgi:hypothetical protein
MAKFYGNVGYGETVESESSPGVYIDIITEVLYLGDVIRNSRRLESGDQVNSDLSVNNSISIVADAYANEHIFAMRYIEWQGARWYVSEVTVEPPRLVLRLGGVYNGPIPVPTPVDP